MNHFIQRILIFFTIGASCPVTTAYPAYLLELVNGNAITVSDFWEERGEIKFCAHGGIMGIARDRVRKIRFCDSPPGLFEEYMQPTIAVPIAPDIIHSATEGGRKTSDINNSSDAATRTVEDMKRQESDLEIIRDEALQRFRSAAKNKDAAGGKNAMKDISKASNELVKVIEMMEQASPDIFDD